MALRYWALIFMLGIGWGSSFMINAILLKELGPLWVATGRVAFGALGCWIYVLVRGLNVCGSGRQILSLCAFGLLANAAPFTFFAIGQQHIASGVAGIINASTPAMSVLISYFWPGGERGNWRKSLGVLAGLAGIVALSLPILQSGQRSAIWAVLVTLCAPLCYALMVHVVRAFKHLEPVVIVVWGLTGAATVMLPLAVWCEGWPHHLSPEGWAALAYTGFVLTSAAFIVFYWVVARVGATNGSVPTLITPAAALVLGVWVLGEPLHLSHLIGLFALLLGLLLIDGRLFNWRVRAA